MILKHMAVGNKHLTSIILVKMGKHLFFKVRVRGNGLIRNIYFPANAI